MKSRLKQVLAAAKTDAIELARGLPLEEDREALTLMRSGSPDWYRLSTLLFSSANFHSRIAVGELVGERKGEIGLVDGWRLLCSAARFRERWAQETAKKYASPLELYAEHRVRWQPTKVVELALAAWKLYAVGRTECIAQLAPIFELFDIREGNYLQLSEEELQSYDLAVCVSLFLARKNASPAAVDRLLASLPVFAGISEFWADDHGFSQFTVRAAQWHFDYSLQTTGEYAAFANVAADVLFPSWVFALDAFRQSALGRPSAIGEHELLDFGQRAIALATQQSCPESAVLVAAEKLEERTFGGKQFDPLPFWNEFLSGEK